MASRFLQTADCPVSEPIVRPALRLVEKAPAAKAMPPAWMIAPPFRDEEPLASAYVRQRSEQMMAASAVADTAPYRSIREVPRFS